MKGIEKITSHEKKGFTKRKSLHRISQQVRKKIVKVSHTRSLPFNQFIWEQATPSLRLIIKNQENTFVVIFQIVIKMNESEEKKFFCKEYYH